MGVVGVVQYQGWSLCMVWHVHLVRFPKQSMFWDNWWSFRRLSKCVFWWNDWRSYISTEKIQNAWLHSTEECRRNLRLSVSNTNTNTSSTSKPKSPGKLPPPGKSPLCPSKFHLWSQHLGSDLMHLIAMVQRPVPVPRPSLPSPLHDLREDAVFDCACKPKGSNIHPKTLMWNAGKVGWIWIGWKVFVGMYVYILYIYVYINIYTYICIVITVNSKSEFAKELCRHHLYFK